mmetsp:Transcript_28791/g.41828  ORF Transcript_28791/g.41828 Transcript_28791/m.41828 type:complete len:92 (-) Transcript_28791:509-784(-)
MVRSLDVFNAYSNKKLCTIASYTTMTHVIHSIKMDTLETNVANKNCLVYEFAFDHLDGVNNMHMKAFIILDDVLRKIVDGDIDDDDDVVVE